MNEAKESVLLGMALLGATNAERSAYENVKDGKAAWDECVAEGLIVKNDNKFYVLSDAARQIVKKLHEKYNSRRSKEPPPVEVRRPFKIEHIEDGVIPFGTRIAVVCQGGHRMFPNEHPNTILVTFNCDEVHKAMDLCEALNKVFVEHFEV